MTDLKDRILFLFDMEWIHFGIAKYLASLLDCELYALIDIDHSSKNFYQTQNLVSFKKSWFYRDYLPKKSAEPDFTYLKSFEDRNSINLWKIAFGERFFFQYNDYYKFNRKEILSILEKECKLFEEIFDEINPDFLIVKFTDSHQSQLLLELAKARGIKTLTLTSTRFGYRYGIFSDYDKIDELSQTKQLDNKLRSLEELQQYLNKYYATREITSLETTTKRPWIRRIKKYLQYLIAISDPEFKNYYANFGRTQLKVIANLFFLKRPYRNNFINRNFVRMINENTKFIYFPLHYEPERQLLQQAPYYREQLTLITQIAQSLPIDYELYVKEHVSMYLNVWRKISFYKRIQEIPNVRLIHPSVSSQELMKKSSVVITIAGTSGLEALFYNKPVIVFSDVSYANLSSVYRIKNIEELPYAIKKMLKVTVNLEELNTYVNKVENNTFEIDLTKLYVDFDNFFSNEFNSARSNISVSKMNSFLELHKKVFEKLASEYVKKIISFKKSSNQNHLSTNPT